MQGSSIPEIDMGAVFIKMNEDGSFNLLLGAKRGERAQGLGMWGDDLHVNRGERGREQGDHERAKGDEQHD